MRHPFDGIVPAPAKDRRSWLKGLLGVFAGLFVWNRAQAQKIEIIAAPVVLPVPPGGRVAVGGGPNDPEPMDPRMSTAVRGEEGAGVTNARGEAAMTTEALREEGAMTRALNEGGIRLTGAVNEAAATSAALREEGAATRAAREAGGGPIRILPAPGRATTLAVGEEGGKK